MDNQTSGHHATSGGLRGHSTGALYPIGIAARVVAGRHWWQPWNLETGEYWPVGFRDWGHAEAIARGMLDVHRTGFNARQTEVGAGIEGVTQITLAGYLNVDTRRVQQ